MPDQDRHALDQKDAEAEVERFKDRLGPFVVAAETTRMPMVFTNAREPGHPIVFANDSFLRLTGYGRDEVLGERLDSLMARGADQDALAKVEAEFRGEGEGEAGGQAGSQTEIEYRRKDGRPIWTALFVSPVRDEGGEVVQHFASFVDLSRHRDAQAQSRMLIDELNHRVKNTLATVQSIVSQALRKSDDLGVVRDAIESRLSALSRSHDLLTRESWTSAGLRDVIVDALEPFGVADGRAERFAIEGEDVRVPPRVVLALGIAFHELATNAVKYGAFSNDQGTVRVDWSVEGGPDGGAEGRAEGRRVVLRWREGGGPPVATPSRRGFGSQVIERGLAYELEGDVSLDYRPEGLLCSITIPMPQGPRG